MNTPIRISLRHLAVTAALALSGALQVNAANVTWTAGSSSDWATGSNWSTGFTPNAATMVNTGDSLYFGTSASVTATNDLVSGGTFSGITFNSGAGAITLSGSGVVLGPQLESSAEVLSGGNITNNSSSTETISLPVTLAPGYETISTASGAGSLSFSGGITIGNGSVVQFSPGGGAISVSSGLANTNGILGGWATSGTNWATLSSGNVVAYSSYTTEADTGGNWSLSSSGGNASNNLKIATSNNSWATPNTSVSTGTMDINSLVYSTGTNNGGINFLSGNVLRFGPQGGVMNATPGETFELNNNGHNDAITAGGSTANASGTLTFIDNLSNTANGSQGLIIYTAIDNNGSGPVTVNVVGNVLFQDYGGTENYSGGTNIQAGRTVYGSSGSYGTGAITVYPGAEAELNFGSATISNAFNLAGYGTPISGSGSGGDQMALRTQGNTFNGVITLTGTAIIGINGSATFGSSNGITGPGGLIVTGNFGSGSMHLGSYANTYQGDTVINAAGYGNTTNNQITVWINSPGNSNVIPSGANAGNLVLVGGNSSGAYAQLDLGGSIQNINGLSTQGGGTAQYTNVTSNPSGGTLVVGNNNATSTFGGTIGTYGSNGSQGVSLTKVGTGALTLSGTSNYTGLTDIENGVLSVTGTLLSTGTVNLDNTTLSGNPILEGNGVVGNVTLPTNNGSDIAHISPGVTGTGSVGTLNLSSLTMNGGDLILDLVTPGSSDFINVTGSAVVPTSSSAWSVTPSLGAASGTYTVLTAGSGISGIGGGTVALPTVNTPASNPLVRPATYQDQFSGSSLQIVVGGGAASIIWTGTSGSGGNGVWDINTTQNWNDSSASNPSGTFYNGDSVTFGDGPTNTNITIVSGTLGETSVSPGAVIVNANTTNYTIGGNPITGAGGLTKSGSATLTLTGADSFTGATAVNGGIINYQNGAAFGGYSVITVASGATVQVQGSITGGASAMSLAGTGASGATGALENVSGNNSYAGAITLTGSTIIASDSGLLILSGGISGGYPLTFNGPGNVTFSGVNTYSGNTVINSGTLTLTNPSGGNGALGSPTIDVNSGAALVLSNNDTLGYTTGRNAVVINDGLLNNNVSGDRDTLYNSVTMTGGTMSAAGSGNSGGAFSWDAQSGSNLLIATSDANGAAALISAQTAVQNSGTFSVTRGSAVSGFSPDLIVSGIIAEEGGGGNSLTITGGGNGGITVFSGANTLSGTTTISNGIVSYQNGTAFGGSGPIIVSSGATAQVQGGIAGGSKALTISGAGDTALGATGALENVSGNNSYNGTVTVSGASTIASDAGILTINGALAGSGKLTIVGPGTVISSNGGSSTLSGNIEVSSGTLEATNGGSTGGDTALGSTATAGRTVTVDSGATLYFATNNVFGNGESNATKIPSITLGSGATLTANNYDVLGNVTLDGATLTGNSTGATNYQQWQLLGTVTVGGASASTVSSADAGATTGGDHLGSNTTFNVGSTGAMGGDLIVSSPLVDQSKDFNNAAGSLTKTGAGTMVLSSPYNSYTGTTTVSQGTLDVTGSLAGTASTSVTNATLTGTGSIANNVTIGNELGSAASAILAPGSFNQLGTLSISGSLTLNSDAEFVFSLDSTGGGAGNGASSLLAATVSLDPASEFSLEDIAATSGVLAPGTQFTAIETSGGLNGTFSNLANGATFTSGPNTYQATYTANNLTVTVVPEPETWGSLVLGFGMLIGISKLRKRPMGI